MKETQKKLIGTAVSILLLLFTLSSCETWREECTGQIIVENEIPDTTLYVGGEPFIRDVFEPPVVFRHTENKAISISSVLPEDHSVVDPNLKLNSSTQEISVVEIIPLKEGMTEVKITAIDECPESQFAERFTVTVIDTTTA